MAETTGTPRYGEYFSRSYLWSEKPLSDDPRARHRMAAYLQEYYSDKAYEIGGYIEKELGIKCRSVGSASFYINWESFLSKLAIQDFLDVVTATIQFKAKIVVYKDRLSVVYNLLEFAKRVFSEQNLAYKIDEEGGVHPAIDLSFSIFATGLIRSLVSQGLEATCGHISQAEKSLLESSFDPRQAIRSTFDAAENLVKVIFPKVPQLNTAVINSNLRPYLIDDLNENQLEKRAADKLVNSFVDWVEAAHFYRHAAGGTADERPTETFSIMFVSQGFSFVRWIADTRFTRSLPVVKGG